MVLVNDMRDSKQLIALFEARLAWQRLPTEVMQTFNGWAAYKGGRRITRFFFSEEGARNAGIEWDASDVKVQFVDAS